MSDLETPEEQWLALNQRYLMAALSRVHKALERHATRQRSVSSTPLSEANQDEREAEPSEPTLESPPALKRLCEVYSLTSFERDTLLLCAGIELDANFHAACGAAQRLPGRAMPTFSLALAALADAHWSALEPQSPLRRGGLIQVLAGESLTTSPLRIDERILHYLTGLSSFDERLGELLIGLSPPEVLPASHGVVALRIAELVAAGGDGQPILLCGPDAAARQAVAAASCAQLGLRLYALPCAEIPQTAAERQLFCRKWEREVLLNRCALMLFYADSGLTSEATQAAQAIIDRLPGLLFLSSREPLAAGSKRPLRIDVPRPPREEQRALWHQALGPRASQLNGHLDHVVSHFSLGQHGILAASGQAIIAANGATDDADDSAPDFGDQLWAACREQARPRLDDLAQRIESHAGWQDLVLPELQRETLRTLIAHKQHQTTVHHEWGFAKKSAHGLGISALFVGSSGTGKTMAAEVLAGELRLDLYRVDLSQVVSKYIGETEKNLRRVFDAAEEGGAVLLFDEADALFGKRSEVKDSHDRYANIEVSYLLARMESYQGVSILTSNMKSAIDSAFLRRLRFVVHFPFPDSMQRLEIWRRAFPAAAPLDGIDLTKLARLNIAGGHIRNIALGAAFLAAAQGESVGMRHLLQSARGEYAKLEKTLTDLEIGGWI